MAGGDQDVFAYGDRLGGAGEKQVDDAPAPMARRSSQNHANRSENQTSGEGAESLRYGLLVGAHEVGEGTEQVGEERESLHLRGETAATNGQSNHKSRNS